MGAAVAALVALGMAGGWLLDKALSTGPAFVLVGVAVGMVAAAAYVVMQFRKYLGSDSNPQT